MSTHATTDNNVSNSPISGNTSPASSEKSSDEDTLIPDFKPYLTLKGLKMAPSSVKFSPNGKWLAASAADGLVKIWHVLNGVLDKELKGHRQGLSEVDWSPDSQQLCTASDDKTLGIWKFRSGKCRKVLKGHTQVVFCCSFNQDGTRIVSGSNDETVRLWDVQSGTCLKLLLHRNMVTSVDFSPCGRMVMASSHVHPEIRIWDIITGELLRSLKDTSGVSHSRYVNDRMLLTSNTHSLLKFVDSDSGEPLKKFMGHINSSGYCIATACSPCGRYIISGSEHHFLYIWSTETGSVVQRLIGHSDVVIGCAWHPTERIIASCGLDNDRTVRLWADQTPYHASRR